MGGVLIVDNKKLKEVERATKDYWRHAVAFNTRNFKSHRAVYDYGFRAGIAINQQFLRLQGRIQHKESVEVPPTWWDAFKKQYLYTFVKWGIIRCWKTKRIDTFLQQDFLFPHVTTAREVKRIMKFFNPEDNCGKQEQMRKMR
jgi:hypothetical protein